MVRMTVKDILGATGGRLASGRDSSAVPSFSTDTRSIIPGSVFIALKGKNFDGHDFLVQAFDKGAAGAIVEKEPGPGASHEEKNIVVVDDCLEAMGRIAAEMRKRADVPVVCITGTNGKTTTKDILAHILSSRYKVLKSRKSFNNIIGLSLTLFDLEPSYQAVVLEVGTNHPGEIPRLAAIAGPHMAIITNIGDGHLEFFGDRHGVFVEKTSLLDFLPDSGMAFLNGDDELLARVSNRALARKFFGQGEGCDFRITGISKKAGGYGFSLNGHAYYLPLEGAHNVHNAAAAIAVAEYFGLTPKEINESLSRISLPGMRLEKVKVDNITFINDSYNANPDSFECALRVLQEEEIADKRGVVAGDMLELGTRTAEFHRMLGRSIAEKGIDFLITIGPNARHMIDGALDSGMDRDSAVPAETHQTAAEMIRHLAVSDTVVLLKGSRSARMEEVLKCFTTSCTR